MILMDGATISLVVEDGRFEKFLRPAVGRLAHEADKKVNIGSVFKTSGCRPKELNRLVGETIDNSNIVIIGADSSNKLHLRTSSSFKKKRRALTLVLDKGIPMEKIVFAVAEPCVEAWIYADLDGLSKGLEADLNLQFKKPNNWKDPRNERDAKNCLGRLIRDGIGGPLPHMGFEYALSIIQNSELIDSSNLSLADWARSFVRKLKM